MINLENGILSNQIYILIYIYILFIYLLISFEYLKRKWAIHVMLNVVVKKFEYFKDNLLLPGLEVNRFNILY